MYILVVNGEAVLGSAATGSEAECSILSWNMRVDTVLLQSEIGSD